MYFTQISKDPIIQVPQEPSLLLGYHPSIEESMATHLLSRGRPLFSFSVGLGLTSLGATKSFYCQSPLRCDAASTSPLTTVSESFKSHSEDVKVPLFKNGRPNSHAYKQISAGSILGTFTLPARRETNYGDGMWTNGR